MSLTMIQVPRPIARFAFVFLLASPAFAAELELRFGAIERLISQELFSQDDGRRYVQGDRSSKCKFAYLQSPHVGAADGRLRVTARFSGRTAWDIFGRCVGVGDSFDFTLLAVPVVRNGAIALQEVNIATPRDSFYIRRVRQALVRSFGTDFKIEIRDQAKRLLEAPAPPAAPNPPSNSFLRPELASFNLGDVRVQSDALVLVVEFRLVVK